MRRNGDDQLVCIAKAGTLIIYAQIVTIISIIQFKMGLWIVKMHT